ncbi:MAG: hypothetical protein R2847_04960 [Bacteroidia bacterium]
MPAQDVFRNALLLLAGVAKEFTLAALPGNVICLPATVAAATLKTLYASHQYYLLR